MDELRGNTQCYAHRWQNQQGRSGYTIACENEWHQVHVANLYIHPNH
ncbi:TOTE conflict system archaeo-eukaryotic primase domain-containing protein [Vibrio sp. ER1A]